MSYLGSSAAPVPVAFSGVRTQSFSGNGSTSLFTLSRAVTLVTDIEVIVNNVQQSPFDGSYSLVNNGLGLQFSENVSAGTNNIYVFYRDQPLGSMIDPTAVRKTGDTMTGTLTVGGNVIVSAESGGVRTIGAASGTNTTVVIQASTTIGGGPNIELTKDNVSYFDSNLTRFRSTDASATFAEFNVNGLGIGAVPEAGSQLRTYNGSGHGKVTIETTDAYQSFLNFSAASNEVSIGFVKADNSFRVCQAGDLSSGELLRVDTGGAFKFNSGYGSVATAYGCRAWVNFNGQGTVAIRASGNVSSITDNGVGDYTANFSTGMPDANYGVAPGVIHDSGATYGDSIAISSLSSGSARITTWIEGTGAALSDKAIVCVSIFR
jgi:hypothetical protein